MTALPYLRKKIPSSLVDRRVWTALSECSSLRLPHVVATYETPDEFVVVCDFVPGDTLHERKARRLPFRGGAHCADVCEAVEELHRRGIAHRDISPRNVLVAADGAHLIDLGIARPLERSPSESPHFDPRLAAPEQYGFAPVDERTDVCVRWSFAGLYACA
ncbi:MAG: protein kinase domain-containing protein [Slackia sp.]